MDTILLNGNFHTLDKAYPHCSAMAVKNGVIIALGDSDEIRKLATETTNVIDLKQKTVVPGFVDSHLHFMAYAQFAQVINLSETKSFDDVREICIKALPKYEGTKNWMQAGSFNQDFWDKKEMPTRKDVDTISRDIPIVLRRACMHMSVCNTKALELMGILDAREGENDLTIGYYGDGTPNGIVYEMAQKLYMDILPEPSFEDMQNMIIDACMDAAAKGITEVHTDDFILDLPDGGKTFMALYQSLAAEHRLPIRIYQQCSLREPEILKDFLENGHCTGENFGFYRIGPLKLMCDGSLGAHTAWMLKPYKNDLGTTGIQAESDEKLYALMKMAHDHGMQIAIHCIGDAALNQALTMYERIQRENPRTDCRHGIVHCQIMDEAQQDRFKKSNILAYIQPIFIKSDMNIVDDCVGEDLARQSYNWRRFEDLGVHQSGGSDCPVEPFDILPNMEYAITRTNPQTGQSWYPENAVTREEALKIFTLEGAYASFSENQKGSLTVGKYADLAVLDRDILAIEAGDIHNMQVLMTMVEGKIVYHK